MSYEQDVEYYVFFETETFVPGGTELCPPGVEIWMRTSDGRVTYSLNDKLLKDDEFSPRYPFSARSGSAT